MPVGSNGWARLDTIRVRSLTREAAPQGPATSLLRKYRSLFPEQIWFLSANSFITRYLDSMGTIPWKHRWRAQNKLETPELRQLFDQAGC